MLFRDELATVVTYLYGSTQNRIDNVALAAQSINGIVLAPGQQFDYNEALGERTTERGYKAAGAYSGGQVVQEVGGGICQVSSMVYYAALLSNLQIDTRTCHYFPVSYVNPGMDATVSWGGPEFRFRNDTGYPLRLLAAVELLPPKYRAVIYLYYYEGYSAKEIAGLLGETPAAVATQLSRGREKLRTHLEQEGFA